MKLLSASLALLLVSVSGFASGQDAASADAAADPTTTFTTQYLLTLSEYQLEKPLPTTATEAEILEAIEAEKLTPIETLRVTAVEDTDSMVQFGKRATITVGMTSGRGPVPTRRVESIEVGTLLKVTIASHAKGAIAEIRYSTSRLADGGGDDLPPDVTTNTVEATQVYELGKPRLLSMSSLGKAPCVVVSIREMR